MTVLEFDQWVLSVLDFGCLKYLNSALVGVYGWIWDTIPDGWLLDLILVYPERENIGLFGLLLVLYSILYSGILQFNMTSLCLK